MESSVTNLSTSEAREAFAEMVNRVAYGGERVVLQRRGKRLAALVSMEDLELLEAIEDADDIAAAEEALAEAGEAPDAEVRRRLGVD